MTNKDRHPWIEPESRNHTKKHFGLPIHLRDIRWAENYIIRGAVKETLP